MSYPSFLFSNYVFELNMLYVLVYVEKSARIFRFVFCQTLRMPTILPLANMAASILKVTSSVAKVLATAHKVSLII